MASWAKALAVAVSLAIALPLAACYGLYWYGASALPWHLQPPVTARSSELRLLYWSTLGGQPPIRIERVHPPGLAWETFSWMRAPHPIPARRQALLNAARLQMRHVYDSNEHPNGRRMLAETALLIRISREWTAAQTIDAALNGAWFGRDANGIDDAAMQWFGKPANALGAHQQLALLSIMQSPSTFDPECRPEAFARRYMHLLENSRLAPDPRARMALADLRRTGCPP